MTRPTTTIRAALINAARTRAAAASVLRSAGVLADGTDGLIDRLANGGVSLPGPPGLDVLRAHNMIEFRLTEAVIRPVDPMFDPASVEDVPPGAHRIGRLAYLQVERGAVVARHPAGPCYLRLTDSAATSLLTTFAAPTDPVDLFAGYNDDAPIRRWCALLAAAQVLQPCDEDGRTADDRGDRRQWDFHDALFHSRSRLGRIDEPIGGTYRFRGELDPAPAVKNHPWHDHVIQLPGVDLGQQAAMDPPLTWALEGRGSGRTHSLVGLTLHQLGVFLARTARVRSQRPSADGIAISKPYPSGGGLYEQELYLTVNQGLDVPRGLYYYDPMRHALCRVSEPGPDMEGLLHEAWLASAGTCRPQVLITIASRHQRVSWKYEGIAYATQLKNVGALYQTMYLVATSMGLAACALGLGNTDRFCRMTGQSWFVEGSIGEFMLGRPA